MKEPDVAVVTPVYSAKDGFLKKIANAVKRQRYSGKINHIFINDNVKNPKKIKGLRIINNKRNLGLAGTLNKGFRFAKTPVIASLEDDCLPSSSDWLRKLIAPLSDNDVAATTSKVELPLAFWNKFDYFAKALTEKEQRIIIPGLDEKGCAYKVSALKEFGYLNNQDFKNGGEDTDLTVKIEKSGKWKIVNSEAKVYHYHHTTFRQRIRKEVQYARLSGLVSRKHFFKLPWNFQANVIARLLIVLFFIYSLVTDNLLWLSVLLVLLISNLRLPFQVRRLGNDKRIVLVSVVNLYVYAIYVINYSYALLFKPVV
jgi:GT2 family glycosyltransferase